MAETSCSSCTRILVVKVKFRTCYRKNNDLSVLSMFDYIWIYLNIFIYICLCLSEFVEKHQTIKLVCSFSLKSLSVRCSVSIDFFYVIVYLSHMMCWHDFSIFPNPKFLLLLHVGFSAICIFDCNFSAECAIRQSSKRVATISDDAISSAILLFNLWLLK